MRGHKKPAEAGRGGKAARNHWLTFWLLSFRRW